MNLSTCCVKDIIDLINIYFNLKLIRFKTIPIYQRHTIGQFKYILQFIQIIRFYNLNIIAIYLIHKLVQFKYIAIDLLIKSQLCFFY